MWMKLVSIEKEEGEREGERDAFKTAASEDIVFDVYRIHLMFVRWITSTKRHLASLRLVTQLYYLNYNDDTNDNLT